MVNIKINGIDYQVEDNISVLEACRAVGIEIPTLCNDDRLQPHAACRLCIVEVEGKRGFEASCSLKVWDGMAVETHSPRVMKARADILDLLFSNHPEDCLTCEKSGDCKLQDYCFEYGVEKGSYVGRRRIIRWIIPIISTAMIQINAYFVVDVSGYVLSFNVLVLSVWKVGV